MKRYDFIVFLAVIFFSTAAVAGPTSGPWGVSVSGFTNFSSAANNPATAGKTIVIDKAVTVNTATTPIDRAIKVIKGGSINVATGKTLTINGPFEASKTKVFTGAGAVIFGARAVQSASPDWWEDNAVPGTTDMATAINRALAAFPVVEMSAVRHKTTAPVSMYAYQTLRGVLGHTTIEPAGCNGITLAVSNNYAQLGKIEGITIDGGVVNPPASGGYTGIHAPGSANKDDQIVQMRITDCYISNIMTGIDLRTAWDTIIEQNSLNNVSFGIKVRGLSVNTKIENNLIRRGPGNVTTGTIGVQVASALDYDPGGATEYRPEDVSITGNEIYGYEAGISLPAGLLIKIGRNMIDVCSLYCIYYTTDNDLTIVDNWLGVTGLSTATGYGIYAANTSQYSAGAVRVVIRDNNIFENYGSLSTNSYGIRLRPLSQNVSIDNNHFMGFNTYDINATGIEQVMSITNNKFKSTEPVNSVYVETGGGGGVVMDNNESAVIPVRLHSISNTVGANVLGRNTGATQSTYRRGQATISSGNTTTTINVPMGTDSNVYPVIRINTIESTESPVIKSSVAYNATTSVITLTSSLAAPVGGIKIYYEIIGVWYGDR